MLFDWSIERVIFAIVVIFVYAIIYGSAKTFGDVLDGKSNIHSQNEEKEDTDKK